MRGSQEYLQREHEGVLERERLYAAAAAVSRLPPVALVLDRDPLISQLIPQPLSYLKIVTKTSGDLEEGGKGDGKGGGEGVGNGVESGVEGGVWAAVKGVGIAGCHAVVGAV